MDVYGVNGGSENVHGGWPFKAFMGGAIDLANFEKDLYYLYQSQWTNKPMIHILPHWTHPLLEEGTVIPVWMKKVSFILTERIEVSSIIGPGKIRALDNGSPIDVERHFEAKYRIRVKVNEKIEEILLPSSKTFCKDWDVIEVNTHLDSGANYIRLTALDDNGLCIDEMKLE